MIQTADFQDTFFGRYVPKVILKQDFLRVYILCRFCVPTERKKDLLTQNSTEHKQDKTIDKNVRIMMQN